MHVTSLCKSLVTSILDTTKELSTVHTEKKKSFGFRISEKILLSEARHFSSIHSITLH